MADETLRAEPSMEEILASIRRIISEDGQEEGIPEDAPVEVESVAGEAAPELVANSTHKTEQVLELTEEVDENGNVMTASEAELESAATKSPPVEMSVPKPEPMAPPAAKPEVHMDVSSEDAAASAFAALASQALSDSADQQSQRITPGGRTIEDHVLEMLRPMLREWLDKHLPQMVQLLVQREIDRITHRSDLR